jgi:hypothetical protein
MLDSQHRAAHFSKARQLNQRINHALQKENASAAGFMESVRSRASEQAHAITQPGRIMSAATVWMSFTFILCYLALPLMRAGVGLSAQSGISILATALASAAGLMGVIALFTVAVAVLRPKASVHVDPDRTLAATSGSLLVWGLLHNILPGLIPFDEMATGELAAFIGSNVIESALFGVMLASFASSGRSAFSLGAMFQVLLFGLSYLAMFSLI